MKGGKKGKFIGPEHESKKKKIMTLLLVSAGGSPGFWP